MTEKRPKDSSETLEVSQELTSLRAKDAHDIVTPSSQDRAKAEADRTNASSGSAGELALKGLGLSKEQIAARMAEQDDSIAIDYGGGKTISRLHPGSEKDMEQTSGTLHSSEAVVANKVDSRTEIDKATNAAGSAEISTRRTADAEKRVEVESHKPSEISKVLTAHGSVLLTELEDTGSLISNEAKLNPIVEPVALTWRWADDLPPGEQKDSIKKLLKEQAVEVSPEIKSALEARDQKRTFDSSQQQDPGNPNVQELGDAGKLQGYVHQIDQNRNEWQVFATLPKERQQQVIQLLAQCPDLITSDYERQLDAIAKAVPKGLVNFGQHTIEAVLGLGRAAGAIMEFCDRSYFDPVGTRERAVKALGEGFEVGLNVCKLSNDYLQGIGGAAVSGDAGKALRDIVWLGQELDQRWQTRSEAQKVEIATELTAGFAVPGLVSKIAKSEKLTAALADLSQSVGPENSQKLHLAIEKVLDNVLERVQDKLKQQPMMRTPEGFLMPVPTKDVGRLAESELGSNVMAMTKYYERGHKYTTPAEEVARKLKVSKQELRQMTEEQLEAHGFESIQKRYDLLFFDKYPHLKGTGLEVHHALPQKLLDKFIGLFKAKEVNSVEYLRGIPKDAMKDGERVHDLITARWERLLVPGSKLTRQQVLVELKAIDKEFGQYFKPPR